MVVISYNAKDYIDSNIILSSVKPLHSGHDRDLEKASAMRTCSLYRGLTFFLKRKDIWIL